MSTNHKFLITLTGPVGSGKTYVARILARKLKAGHVRTDDIRVWLRKRGNSFALARKISREYAKNFLANGKSVIYDFDAILPDRRTMTKKLAEEHGAKFFLIKINTPEKVILKRLREKKYTSKDIFKNYEHAVGIYSKRKKLHEKLRHQKLKIKPDFVINNARPLTPQITKVIKKMKSV